MFKIENNINKLIAFNPVLDTTWRKNQKINSPKSDMEIIDLVENFQNEGWYLEGATSSKNRNNKYSDVNLKFINKDLTYLEYGNNGGYANLLLNININDFQVHTSLGALRMVCDNSLVVNENHYSNNFYLNKTDQIFLNNLNNGIDLNFKKIYKHFEELQEIELNDAEQKRFAKIALQSRFNHFTNKIDYTQLLKVNRVEDEGRKAWKVFNRVQENIIKPNMIKDSNGKLISYPLSPKVEENINKKLFTGLERVLECVD